MTHWSLWSSLWLAAAALAVSADVPAEARGPWAAGLVEVNATDHSQMFYWYFPPRDGNASAPMILWLQGGPGASGLVGALYEIGPFALQADGKGGYDLAERAVSWANHMAVLVVDSPVGTGYSRAGSEGGYSTNEDEVSENLVQLLLGFQRLYPHEGKRPLYVAAESYGGHYAPNLCVYIMEHNQRQRAAGQGPLLPLSGMALADGITDPGVQELLKPQAAYNFGLLDLKQLAKAQALATEAVALAAVGQYDQARDLRLAMEEYIANCSGVNLLDVREFGDFSVDEAISVWANDSATKAMLGLPKDAPFQTDRQVIRALRSDLMKSYADKVASLLDDWGLPVLLWQGQFDLKDGPVGNKAWIRRMRWSGAAEYLRAPNVRWYVDDDPSKPAGWAQQAGLLTEVVVAGAGHLGPMTQPERNLDMITRWTAGRPFAPASGAAFGEAAGDVAVARRP